MPSCQKNNNINSSDKPWIGRFAPSPTGPLHLGSLVAAVASYMIAKQRGGRWLVRIEDLDPPREVSGASRSILTSLEEFGLFWDGEVVYQSQRNDLYQQRFEELIERKIVYQCDCSRKVIEARNQGIYDGYCRNRKLPDKSDQATRIKFLSGFEDFDDQILGSCQFNADLDSQDYVVKRRDGLFAYQLAVVADDIDQGINHVVRGLDILDSTPRQNLLYHCFAETPPSYYHLPLVKDSSGIKLSKRQGALAVNKQKAAEVLLQAFQHLGQNIDIQMVDSKPVEIISYFEKNWQLVKIPVMGTSQNQIKE